MHVVPILIWLRPHKAKNLYPVDRMDKLKTGGKTMSCLFPYSMYVAIRFANCDFIPLFRRRNFQMRILEWKCMHFANDLTENCY